MPDKNKQVVLISDLDGTILKSMPVAWEYLSRIALKKGKKLKHYSQYHSTFDLYIDVTFTFGLRALKLLPRMRRYMYLNADRIPAYQGAIETLIKLHGKGWKVVIVTDNDEDYARKALEFNSPGETNWIEIHSAETESKLAVLHKVLKKYKDSYMYFASHDSKDFFLLRLASLTAGVTAHPVFTPNEIDKNSLARSQSSLGDFIKKLKIENKS